MGNSDSGNGCFIFCLILITIFFIKPLGILIIAIIGIVLVYKAIQKTYHFFSPEAKEAYLLKKAQEKEELRKEKIRKAKEKARLKEERKIGEQAIREERKIREQAIRERAAKEEQNRINHRDAEQQFEPYVYRIDKHGNEALAIRYGIANHQKKVKEYWYYEKGGERKRNTERDKIYFEPSSTIRLQKTKKLGKDLYEVLLSDHRNRKAKAIIEVGTEYVKTFYPYENDWFEKHADLEESLKGNGTFNLKELATFHVQKTVGS